MEKILDLHTHSRYSRSCSKDLIFPNIAKTCEIRGIDILSTGDFTHPKWFSDIKELLKENNEGMYVLKDGTSKTQFLIGTEVASIKKHKDKTRRVHHLIFAPNIEVADKFNHYLDSHGFNLKSDGRPILGITSKEILEIMLSIDPRMVMIPAHAWTPWFGIFGSKGGYSSLEEAYDELATHIFSIETGLSSDPAMNWRVSALDRISLISNSDAHSPAKLGREANIFGFEHESDITYNEIMRILREGDRKKFMSTIEFYPEEGKYHYDGHATCLFSCTPEQTKKYNGRCPKCKKPLVIGVMNRVDELADRTEAQARAEKSRIPYKNLVPLVEIISGTLGVGVSTKSVKKVYDHMIHTLGNEFHILLRVHIADIEKSISKDMAEAIERVRTGNIFIQPGYDGIFGVVKVFTEKENQKKNLQMGFHFQN